MKISASNQGVVQRLIDIDRPAVEMVGELAEGKNERVPCEEGIYSKHALHKPEELNCNSAPLENN